MLKYYIGTVPVLVYIGTLVRGLSLRFNTYFTVPVLVYIGTLVRGLSLRFNTYFIVPVFLGIVSRQDTS